MKNSTRRSLRTIGVAAFLALAVGNGIRLAVDHDTASVAAPEVIPTDVYNATITPPKKLPGLAPETVCLYLEKFNPDELGPLSDTFTEADYHRAITNTCPSFATYGSLAAFEKAHQPTPKADEIPVTHNVQIKPDTYNCDQTTNESRSVLRCEGYGHGSVTDCRFSWSGGTYSTRCTSRDW